MWKLTTELVINITRSVSILVIEMFVVCLWFLILFMLNLVFKPVELIQHCFLSWDRVGNQVPFATGRLWSSTPKKFYEGVPRILQSLSAKYTTCIDTALCLALFPLSAESTLSHHSSEVVISGQVNPTFFGMRKLKHKEIREVVQSSMNGFTVIILNLYNAFLFKELNNLPSLRIFSGF